MSEKEPAQELSDLITYPADMSIKAMGLNANNFEACVIGLLSPIIAPQRASKVDTRESSGGKYLSVTVHFKASDAAHYELVYSTLRDDARVLFTL
ncbi:MAG: DUF493 domain-containing protein [Granulosicoccaceae bacterium]